MEKRDLYDKDKNRTGKYFYKGEKLPEGYYYLLVGLLIENLNGEFLMQKRCEKKGGKWAGTGGHAKAGQSGLDAVIDEAKEELGIDISKYKLNNYLNVVDHEERVFVDFYYVKADIDINDIIIQKEELTEVKYFTKKQIEQLIQNDQFDSNNKDMYYHYLDYLKNK